MKESLPLVVDLDGTLVKTDTLWEAIFALVKENIYNLFLLPLWLLKGKAQFKKEIAERVDLDFTIAPYNQPFLEYLKEQKTQGRHLILATASNIKFANQVAKCLGIFDEVLASDASTNLSGRYKLHALVSRFGKKGYDYAANSAIDLLIWAEARKGILVNASRSTRMQAGKLVDVEKIFIVPSPFPAAYFKAFRLHQWVKNLLIFVPLVLAHRVLESNLLLQAGLAFLSFGLCASSVYLLNDLLDLSSDRHHPIKRHRPLAAGILPIQDAVLLIPLLLLAAFVSAAWLPPPFLATLALYYGSTMAYSIKIKQMVLIDVLVLAGLYTIRLLAGGASVGIPLSSWLLAFSMFLFFSLALVKRYSDLLTIRQQNRMHIPGRGYRADDLETLATFGVSSGYLAVLVMALYINSESVTLLYNQPGALWLVCPLLLYWISRIWILTRRGQMHHDPVIFAITDPQSYWLCLGGAIILWLAI
jgi:4-hydroxybenzoate polyprenyltransferase